MSGAVNRRVLIIDDNRAIHEDFKKILTEQTRSDALDAAAAALFGDAPPSQGAGAPTFELDFASQGQEGFAKVQEAKREDRRYALAFVDMRMPPGWDGMQTIEKIWEVDPDLQIVICSAYSDYSWTDILKKFGAADRLLILKKPFDTAEVCQLACALTEKWQLARYAHLKLHQLQAMVEEQTRALQAEVTERRRSEAALRTSEDRYALAAAASNDGLWDWDLVRGEIYFSSRWKSMFGLLDSEISRAPAEWFDRIEPEDLPRLESELSLHLDGKTPNLRCEYRIKHKDQKPRWMLCHGLAVRDAAGKPNRIAGFQTDITDRKMAEAQLRHDALHDALTGLPNRAMLTERLRHCMMQCKRKGSLFAVLFLDLDRFKVVNDSLGHEAGDKLLIGIARRLLTCVRELDLIARIEPGHVVRLGGDEFVLLLEEVKDATDALRVADRIQKMFAEPFNLNGHEVFSSGSVGIAIGHSQYADPDDILRDADTALYQAKALGKGRYEVFDRAMHVSAVARLRVENELRRALEREELVLHFQPIISLATGEVTEFEALVRWQHPERGLIPPGDFIPVAEETGLIVPMGYWVLREACLQLRRWETQFPGAASLCMNVNISGKQFTHSRVVEEIEAILAETGIRPERLHLEITESVAMECAGTTSVILDRLSKLNLQLHLDDFGTGYSSLSHLHRMPVDAMKIDRSFVNMMATDPASHSIVKAVVALAHTLNMRVIAEGVETQQQLNLLRASDCDYAQGYLISKPLPAEKVLEFLACRPQRRLAVVA